MLDRGRASVMHHLHGSVGPLGQHTRDVVIAVTLVAGLVFLLAIIPISASAGRGFLQVIVVGAGLYASYEFGRTSARGAAEDLVRPHARSAFRHVASIGAALTRQIESVESKRALLQEESENSKGMVRFASIAYILDILAAQIAEQVEAAAVAVEDWNDVVPDELERLKARMRRSDGE